MIVTITAALFQGYTEPPHDRPRMKLRLISARIFVQTLHYSQEKTGEVQESSDEVEILNHSPLASATLHGMEIRWEVEDKIHEGRDCVENENEPVAPLFGS